MKIGIISDTHGIPGAWQKAMKIFDGADLIVHAGDVLYHPPRLGCTPGYDLVGLVNEINNSPIPVVIARGNCDCEVYEELLKTPPLSPYAFVQVEGLRILVLHGHITPPEQMKVLADKYHADVMVTGHTHLPVVEKVGDTVHINPGSPSHPKYEVNGVPTPSVGIIMDGKVSVVELETGKEIVSMQLP